jgi:hypothetical protein
VSNHIAVDKASLDIKVARIDETIGEGKKVYMEPSINFYTKGQYYLGKKTAAGGKSIKTARSMSQYDTKVPMAVASPRELESASPSGDLIPTLHHVATIPALKLGNLPKQAYFFGKFESYGKNPYMPPRTEKTPKGSSGNLRNNLSQSTPPRIPGSTTQHKPSRSRKQSSIVIEDLK